MIARLYVADGRSHLLDDARSFVAEHPRQRQRVLLVNDDEIRMTHAGRDDSDEDFVRARTVKLQFLLDERSALLADDSGGDLHFFNLGDEIAH
jgi:hypothetical protein